MKDKHKRELRRFVINGSAVVGAVILKKLMEKAFESLFDKEPPKKPDEQEDVTWPEAIGWAALTGAMAGALKLVVRRGELDQLL